MSDAYRQTLQLCQSVTDPATRLALENIVQFINRNQPGADTAAETEYAGDTIVSQDPEAEDPQDNDLIVDPEAGTITHYDEDATPDEQYRAIGPVLMQVTAAASPWYTCQPCDPAKTKRWGKAVSAYDVNGITPAVDDAVLVVRVRVPSTGQVVAFFLQGEGINALTSTGIGCADEATPATPGTAGKPSDNRATGKERYDFIRFPAFTVSDYKYLLLKLKNSGNALFYEWDQEAAPPGAILGHELRVYLAIITADFTPANVTWNDQPSVADDTIILKLGNGADPTQDWQMGLNKGTIAENGFLLGTAASPVTTTGYGLRVRVWNYSADANDESYLQYDATTTQRLLSSLFV